MKSPSYIRILFADNDKKFLETRSEFFPSKFQVLQVSTVEEVEQYLRESWVHLAILDIRMKDDNDAGDVSGLDIAKSPLGRSIPKIMLTGHPTYEKVREALGSHLEGLPAAVDFLAKQEGPEALLQTVEKALEKHVRINWNLVIQLNEQTSLSFLQLVSFIDPLLEGEGLFSQAGELEDLFRKLFYEKEQIRIDRPLWNEKGRVALIIFAFQEETLPEAFVVVCGKNELMSEEVRLYQQHRPKGQDAISTTLENKAETTHFAANAYVLPGADLENICPLIELYRTGTERLLATALENLFTQSLSAWHQNKLVQEKSKTLDKLYRERFAWTEAKNSQETLNERIQVLVRQIPTLGTKLEQSAEELTFDFYGQPSYPNPSPFLFQNSNIGQPVLLMNSPGYLSGENILTNEDGRTWLTDFSTAGLAPQLWNFVAIEATIRFDWTETNKLVWLHDMEQCLISGDFATLDLSTIEPPLRKPIRAIQLIRRLAAHSVGRDPLPYHLGILFHAANRLFALNPALQLTQKELARFAHLLLAMTMICKEIQLSEHGETKRIAQAETGIQIDEVNRAARVNGIRVSLSPQSYELLLYLSKHASQLCTRRELIEQVFGRQYDESNTSQTILVNTAIRRLREKIETDPSQPRYVLTDSGGGYRLVS